LVQQHSTSQSWSPYSGLDEGFLQRRVAVARESPEDDIEIPPFVHAHQLVAHWHAGLEPRRALVKAAAGDPAGRADGRLRALLVARLMPTAPRTQVVIDAYDELFDSALADALDEAIGWLTGLVRRTTGPSLLVSSRPTALRSPFVSLVEDDPADDDFNDEPATPR
jgi:hypothetical protein